MQVPSDLPLRQAQGQAVERWRDPDLAGEPAVGQPCGGGAVEERILVLADRVELHQPGLVDIDMAGGADAVAAAFGRDPLDAVADGRAHHRQVVVGIDLADLIPAVDEGDPGHASSYAACSSRWALRGAASNQPTTRAIRPGSSSVGLATNGSV